MRHSAGRRFLVGFLLSALPAWFGEPLLVGDARAQVPAEGTLTLADALALAADSPVIRGDEAGARAATASARQARSVLLPQVSLDAGWSIGSSNAAIDTGLTADPAASSRYDVGIGASQLLWDSGQSIADWRSAREDAAAAADLAATNVAVREDVRTAYFAASAARELVQVARDTLANQERHLVQVTAFIEIGTRPEIDRAQSRTDVANARVQLIQAEHTYTLARAQLDQAVGRPPGLTIEVGHEEMPAVEGEDGPLDTLVERASRDRPEVAAMARRVDAASASVRAATGGYGPDLSASAGLDAETTQLDRAALNWSAGLGLSWSVWSGGATAARVAAARAAVEVVQAQADALALQVRLEVASAQMDVRSALAVEAAAGDAVEAARQRLRLAEGRYETGVGSAVELGDAQLAATAAASQQVRAGFDLAAARARLLASLGSP